MNTMKAVRFHGYGGPEVLCGEDAPIPEPGEGQVLIRVHAAGVNPYDAALRQGYLTGWVNLTFPFIPGVDAAGVIEAIGAGVTGFKVGDEVIARADPAKDGSYAQFVAVDAAAVAVKPRSLDFIKAAGVPLAGLTAWQALFGLADLQPGQTILIQGAAGGVGHLACQFAKWRGATVFGTTSVHNVDFLHELEVDQAIDYTTTLFEDVVYDADVVLDNVGGETQERSFAVLKKGGILVSPAQMPSAELADKYGVRQAFVYSMQVSPLAEIVKLIDEGKVKPVVASVHTLADVQQAHREIETHHTHGKIILKIAD